MKKTLDGWPCTWIAANFATKIIINKQFSVDECHTFSDRKERICEIWHPKHKNCFLLNTTHILVTRFSLNKIHLWVLKRFLLCDECSLSLQCPLKRLVNIFMRILDKLIPNSDPSSRCSLVGPWFNVQVRNQIENMKKILLWWLPLSGFLANTVKADFWEQIKISHSKST